MGRLFGAGVNQADLVDLIVSIRAKITGIQAKLDLDSGVVDTNYQLGTTTALAALSTGIQTTRIRAIRNQGEISNTLDDIIGKWNATLTKLDNDGGVNATNYNALWAVTDVVGNSKQDAIFRSGIYQGAVVRLLNNLILSINGVVAKLDLDSQVNDTTYTALWAITDTVVEQGTYSRMRKLAFIFAIGSLFGIGKVRAQPWVSGGIFVSSVAYTQNYDLDSGKINRFAVQAVYSTATITTVQTFTDGAKSTDFLTVNSTLPLNNPSSPKTITINGVTLTFGVEISSTVGTTTLLAQSISSAIINSASLSTVIISTSFGNVLFATATTVGVNAYTANSSTAAALTWNLGYFNNGRVPEVSIAADTISTTTPHRLVRGQAVLFSSVTATTPIGGLVAETTYYVVPSANGFAYSLSTSVAQAALGNIINLTGTLGGGSSWKFTPLAYTAPANVGFKWQVSNDKNTWTDLSTVSFSSVTITGSGSNIWDFGAFNYKWLRAAFVGPTQGFLNIMFLIGGKLDQ